jgi:hypothetical protein
VRQYWPIKSKELSLTGNGIPKKLGSARGEGDVNCRNLVDEQVQTGEPTLGS